MNDAPDRLYPMADLVAAAPAAIYLGRDGKQAFMAGRLDRFRAFNVALGDEEILKHP